MYTGISTKVSRNLKRNHLSLIKRNKRFLDKKEKEPKQLQDINIMTDSIKSLTEKCDYLENNLNILEHDNKEVLKDNRLLCLQILKLRRDAEIKPEKLMFFMMSYMLKIKNIFNRQQFNDSSIANDEISDVYVNSNFMKTELDSYFENTKSDEINMCQFINSLEQNMNNNTKNSSRFPSVAVAFKDRDESDSETYAKNASQCDSIDDIVPRTTNLKHRKNFKN